MNFIVVALLVLIGYYVLRAFWSLYKVVQSDRPQRQIPKKSRYSDEFGKDLKVEDARWRDIQ